MRVKPLYLWAALLTVAITIVHLPPTWNDHTILLTNARLVDTSLAGDPLVKAAFSATYTLAPRVISAVFAAIARATPLRPMGLLVALAILMWGVQGALVARLALRLTGDDLGALLAAGIFAFGVMLFAGDYTYAPTYFERSLGLTPALYALCARLEGRFNRAWIALLLGTYLHVDPGLYLVPFFLLEELLDGGPLKARLTRSVFAVAALIPLAATTGAGMPPGELAYWRMGLFRDYGMSSGFGLAAADHALTVGGAALIVAAWRGLKGRVDPFAARLVLLGAAVMAAGTLSYALFPMGTWLWGLFTHAHLWKSMFQLQLVGLIVVGAWLAKALRDGEAIELWPGVLIAILLSQQRDSLMRLAGAGAAWCLVTRRVRPGQAIMAVMALVPVIYGLAPSVWLSATRAAGLHGGFFALPTFGLEGVVVWIAALAMGELLRALTAPRRQAVALASCGLAALSLSLAQGAWGLRLDSVPLADWVRLNTAPDAVVLVEPGAVSGCKIVMARAERSFFPCEDYLEASAMYGTLAGPAAGRLRSFGFRPEAVEKPGDIDREWAETARRLTPGKVLELAREFPDAYFLARDDGRAWPGVPIERSGKLVLYKLPGAAPDGKTLVQKRPI